MNSVEQIACWVFDCDRARLYLRDYEANEERIKAFKKALDSYNSGVPLQYIIGETEFMGLKLHVNSSVLIPRPETEILVENVISLIRKESLVSPYILDLGTGSGAIAVSLTKYQPLCRILASDISAEALEIARRNAVLNGVDDRVNFVSADLLDGIGRGEIFDLVIANPPYIPNEEFETLPLQVKNEPRVALDGGRGGLEFYERIIPESVERLKSGGFLVLEMGDGQSKAVLAMLEETKAYCETDVVKDYNGIDRVIFARKR